MSYRANDCDAYNKKGIACRISLNKSSTLWGLKKSSKGICNSSYGVTAFEENGKNKNGEVLCKRTKYTGSAQTCCINQASGNHACDPKLVPGNSACDSTLYEYCGKSNNMITKECIAWFDAGSNQSKQVMTKYCNTPDGIKSQKCKDWCVKNGGCDTAMADYCRNPNNANDSICSCINSKITRAECFDEKCTRYGYKTEPMRGQTDCGTLVQCFQRFSIDGQSNLAAQNEVILNCTQNSDAKPLIKEGPNQAVTYVDDNKTDPATNIVETKYNYDNTDDSLEQKTEYHFSTDPKLNKEINDNLPIIIICSLFLLVLILIATGLGISYYKMKKTGSNYINNLKQEYNIPRNQDFV